MSRALELARRGWGHTSPNPMVGAVICANGIVVGEGYHAALGEPHAEIVALNAAGESARGATLCVTLEPCNHHGRTPPCTAAIIAAGISRVVVAVADPNPLAGGGAARLLEAGIPVDLGVLEKDARELNASFFHSFGSEYPFITLKLAISLDGAISDAQRTRRWLTNEASRAEVQRIRAAHDAIGVGIQTALADDPELTARTHPPPRVPALRVVFDRNARLEPGSVLARTAGDTPVLLVTAQNVLLPDRLAAMGVEAVAARDLRDALRQLKERGVTSMVVEGGAGLAASFLAVGCVDRLVIFQAPLILGRNSLGAFSGVAGQDVALAPRFRLIRTQSFGDDVMSVYAPDRHSRESGNPFSPDQR
ncbi:MAG: bifunctional diaminohydroxyphosphoribosylaminopyrimidine deaminase/5-amino-6-(5-phosphoribosylamino)uracil reductase RibD [Gemmatimonadaceae bacterium]|nr:bifunctional diaminohydroxyphosphoribosylaminopyrimidine deaminase/5-amino-6-(5-phosphoribosylamino)uracil reductase RibD [Gemmatimonadaceae bacterium]